MQKLTPAQTAAMATLATNHKLGHVTVPRASGRGGAALRIQTLEALESKGLVVCQRHGVRGPGSVFYRAVDSARLTAAGLEEAAARGLLTTEEAVRWS